MTAVELARLDAAARAATPGPWEQAKEAPYNVRTLAAVPMDGNPGKWVGYMNWQPEDAAYIAAANPDVILALLADRDRLAAALAAFVNDTYETHYTPSSESGPEEWDYTLSAPEIETVEAALRLISTPAASPSETPR